MELWDLLGEEDKRNLENHQLYVRFLRRAYGPEVQVMVAHHIVCELPGVDIPMEINSGDTLMFNHTLMRAVFKENARMIMGALAGREPKDRSYVLKSYLDALDNEEQLRREGKIQTV